MRQRRTKIEPCLLLLMAGAAGIAGCEAQEQTEAPIYDVASVDVRDIEVTVEAAGVVEPEATVEVKSKASGEILAVHADTGDIVEEGDLLVEVDQRTPRNQLAESEASLVAAGARRRIAQTQVERSETLYESGTLTQTEFEQAQLEFANAQAQVVSAEVAVENARISMDDTSVRAPISGTIIDRQVEPGMVISSPTQAVSDGTILMTMADLTLVQVRTLVDETDIGKVQPGMPATVVVASYPNQPFEGQVLKTEPLAIAEQNVTMFAVLILLENQDGLLMPGMNAQVEIGIASREAVAAVPTAALRTYEDIPATAGMLGIEEERLISMLYGESGVGSAQKADAAPDPGVPGYQFGGEYWLMASRGGGALAPITVETGLTDLEYTEVLAGLEIGDEVLLLPSTSLFEQQARLQDFINRRFSGGSPFGR